MVQRRVYRGKSSVEPETASFMSKRRREFYWAGWREVESEEGWGSRPGGSFGGLSLLTGRRSIFSCFYNRRELSGLAPVHVLVTVFCTLFMIIYFLGSLFQLQISEMQTFSPSFHLLYQTHSRGSVFTGRSSEACGIPEHFLLIQLFTENNRMKSVFQVLNSSLRDKLLETQPIHSPHSTEITFLWLWQFLKLALEKKRN